MMSSAMDSADMSRSTSTYKTIPQYFTMQTGWSLRTGDATKTAISNKRHKILLQNSPQLFSCHLRFCKIAVSTGLYVLCTPCVLVQIHTIILTQSIHTIATK